MTIAPFLPYMTVLSLIGSGAFAVWKWLDQRNRELAERRFEQYWKLIDLSQESKFLAKQKVALLLLKRFPEFRSETCTYLHEAKKVENPWSQQNARQIDDVLAYSLRT